MTTKTRTTVHFFPLRLVIEQEQTHDSRHPDPIDTHGQELNGPGLVKASERRALRLVAGGSR